MIMMFVKSNEFSEFPKENLSRNSRDASKGAVTKVCGHPVVETGSGGAAEDLCVSLQSY